MLSFISYGQGFNDDKISLTNFIKRIYNNSAFEGVKLIEDYENKYIISVVSLDNTGKSISILSRIAQTKAQRQISAFFNGAVITSEFIIKSIETKVDSNDIKITVETIEYIKENSVGFVNGMELLVNFNSSDEKRMVFIFYKKLDN